MTQIKQCEYHQALKKKWNNEYLLLKFLNLKKKKKKKIFHHRFKNSEVQFSLFCFLLSPC